MKSNLNLPIDQLTPEYLRNIKLVAFDCDGVTVKKGTEFIAVNGQVAIRTNPISSEMISGIKLLSGHFQIVFTSGRALSYLQKMYQDVLGEQVYLQSEIGMFTWVNQEIIQNYVFSQYEKEAMVRIKSDLTQLLTNSQIKGFEPKDQIITLHAHTFVPEVEKIVHQNDPQNQLYCWWNEEAYDIGSKNCSKGTGLKQLTQKLGLEMSQVMTVGNGINDVLMTDVTGLDISTDPKHLSADFQVSGEHLGGQVVINRVLSFYT